MNEMQLNALSRAVDTLLSLSTADLNELLRETREDGFFHALSHIEQAFTPNTFSVTRDHVACQQDIRTTTTPSVSVHADKDVYFSLGQDGYEYAWAA